LAAAEVTGKAIAEAHKIQALKPGLRLGERLFALHSVECEAERDVVARRLPGQQRIVLEQDAELRARKVRFDRARDRRPYETHEPALLNREAQCFEDRLPAIGNG